MTGDYPVPETLSWDCFRGAGLQYHPIYHPFNWRGWVDWGQGARRHGRASDRSSSLGPAARHAERDQYVTPFNGLSERDEDRLRLPGAQGCRK
jgi:hypothetical protein